MKIQVFRQSKAPVKIEAFELYQKDWTRIYDKVMDKYGTNIENMEKIQKLLDRVERSLTKKYDTPVFIEIPKSSKKMKAICKEYGAPVMFAERMDGKGIVCIIMDALS